MPDTNDTKKEDKEAQESPIWETIKILFSTIAFVRLDFPKSDCVERMSKVFSKETNLQDNLRGNLELAKYSFEEIKHLTEYEDEKANRILAAVAFLSALSGILFVNLVPKNINGHIIPIHDLNIFGISYYCLFFLFVICLVIGAIGVLGSIEPRFNLGAGKGKSLLFAPLVVKNTPENWVNNFQGNKEKELQLEFTKCYVIESYLIAEKIRDKLKYLQPSVQIIRFSIMILLLWVITAGARLWVSPVEGPQPSSSSQTAQPPSKPVQNPQTSTLRKAPQPSAQKGSSAPSQSK